MTRNEHQFIENWIKYHGVLFGFENLYIIDWSDHESIFEIYRKYEKHGLNVFHSDANLNELESVINQHMHENKGEDSFLIKVDTDEFLAHSNFVIKNRFKHFAERLLCRKGDNCSKYLIHDHVLRNDHIEELLSSLPITGQRYEPISIIVSEPSFEKISDPINEINTFKPINLKATQGKSFFHSESFRSTDLGGHSGVTTNNKGVIQSPLAVIHYHDVSIENTVRSAKQAILSHLYIDENDNNDVAREKLLELERGNAGGGYLSRHKVLYYLGYLNSIDPTRSEESSPLLLANHLAEASSAIKNTLVKDTLTSLIADERLQHCKID
jgi:hypothetical protein